MAAEKKWLFTLCSAALISLFLYFSAIAGFSASSALFSRTPSFYGLFAVRHGASYPSAFAYYIFGSRGTRTGSCGSCLPSITRAIGTCSTSGRRRPIGSGRSLLAVPAMEAFGNVDVVGKPDALTYMGSSTLAVMVHAAATLLRLDGGWNWFLTLSAMDYPLLTQDGTLFLHKFPRKFNRKRSDVLKGLVVHRYFPSK